MTNKPGAPGRWPRKPAPSGTFDALATAHDFNAVQAEIAARDAEIERLKAGIKAAVDLVGCFTPLGQQLLEILEPETLS